MSEKRLEKEPERMNFDRAVLMSAEAALLMKDDQRIKGLHNYLCNLELDMNLSWMLGCALQSQRKYEKGRFFQNKFSLYTGLKITHFPENSI